MVVNIFPADPYPTSLTLGKGSIGHKSTFLEHGHVAYQIKENHEMQQHGSKYFASLPLDPGDGVNGSKFVSSEHVHVKLNGITKCGNMVTNILPADPFP